MLAHGTSATAGTVPSGFQETTAFSGLNAPTAVRFAPDGRIFVAEKRGVIKVFDGFEDSTATVFADLRTQVFNQWDRGLLGMELSRDWSDSPAVYVSYARDAPINGTPPTWGTPGTNPDPCPNGNDRCVISGRISRLPAAGSVAGSEVPLVTDYCQQYPGHSMGALEMDASGRLYASAGEGASAGFADYGQGGNPKNGCGDPPVGVGGNQTPPRAEGGALRSQDLRTSGDPLGLNGSLIRIDPQTGEGVPGNPLFGDPDPNARRILAHGFRNPYRFALSNSGDVYVGDVGWLIWEEINRFPTGGLGGALNFGWPCYEGAGRQAGYDAADLSICENLYSSPGAVTAPFYAYRHKDKVVAGETCPTGSSSISGLELYEGGSTFPANYRGALFFADAVRNCIWVMRAGPDGRPNPAAISTFDAGASWPVDLELGPDGAIYYVDVALGQIQRIQYTAGNLAPVAAASADPTFGPTPLTVEFDATGSSEPDGDPITYAWDLDGDGQYDDSAAANPTHTYAARGTYHVSLRVTDDKGATGTAAVTIGAGNTPPAPVIASPPASQRWRVGTQIPFSGSASDTEDGTVAASALDWNLIMHHCPSNCHEHLIQTFEGQSSGNFTAPDHEYPSHLELRLTATDSDGLSGSTSVRLNPRTVNITLQSQPAGLSLALNGTTRKAPFTTAVIEGSANSISAPTPQTMYDPTTSSTWTYTWRSWSDGLARTHNIKAWLHKTYKATYRLEGLP
jgi:PKD repeat protein